MDLEAIERSLRASSAGAILVEPRLLRRVIKRHRGLPGLGLQVPHARCYALSRTELLGILAPGALGQPDESLPSDVILVSRPAPDELLGKAPYEVLAQLWRAAFHARIHLALNQRIEAGALTEAAVKERIDSIGQTEFDEIRAVLRQDDLLLPPYDDRETYSEFTALYLELRSFAPRLIERMFPGLRDLGRVEAAIAADVDAGPLLEGCRPDGAAPISAVARGIKDGTSLTFSAPPTLALLKALSARAPRVGDVARLIRTADAARAKGNLVRSALLRLSAAGAEGSEEPKLRAGARADLDALGDRLSAALRPVSGEGEGTVAPAWTSLLLMVAEEASLRRGLRYPVEARLLYDLQRACIANERSQRAVDLVTWALSFGRRPIVRPLPLTREVRIARFIRFAEVKLRHVRVAGPDRKLLGRLLRWARERAEDNVRAALRPRFLEVLLSVGLRPVNAPERVAQRKLIEELLDQAVNRGFLSIGPLRDALSRNQMKLSDLSGARELLSGDALIEADRRLAIEIDGVYRRGEVYLRSLQRLSSIAFGTVNGRRLVLYLLLPFGAAYMLLEGASHMVNPLLKAMGLGAVHLVKLPVLLATAALLFGLLHSATLRAWGKRALSIMGRALGAVFLRFPRWVLSRPAVQRALKSRAARLAARYVITPLIAAVGLYALTPLHEMPSATGLGGAAAIFVAANLFINSRLGILVGEVAIDWLALQWKALSRRVLPGLFRLIVDTFRSLMELIERAIYKVDEWLRFREGEHRLTLGVKAMLGLVWFVVAYVIRLYIVLLIEPEVNPIKHFPVVTVAHKIVLPFTPEILHFFQSLLSPFGPVVASAIAGPTVFLLPSVFGFLVWEFKENWRLYRASRDKILRPVLIGSHGETMQALMTPGFHSGTLPKLFAKLRRAARRADEDYGSKVSATHDASGRERLKTEGSLGRYREALQEVDEAVRRLVERELVGVLREAPGWSYGDIEVRAIELGSNRVRVVLACPRLSRRSCEIAFEEQSGLIVASVGKPGFVDALPGAETAAGESAGPPSASPRLLFENALAGLYKLASVDLVRESLEAELGGALKVGSLASVSPGASEPSAPRAACPPYDIAEEGLVVWPGKDYRTEVVYDLDDTSHEPMLVPSVRGEALASPPPPLDARRILYREQRITWTDWVDAWSVDRARAGSIPRLLRGPSILPPRS